MANEKLFDPLDEVEGQALIVKWTDSEKHEKIQYKADEGFGPFVIVAYETDGSAHFRMSTVGVSPWMMSGLVAHMRFMAQHNIAHSLLGQKAMNQVLKPGLQLPPNLDLSNLKR